MPNLDGMDVVTRLETDALESAVVMINGYPSVVLASARRGLISA
jgi:FixJ family two-component response regulator